MLKEKSCICVLWTRRKLLSTEECVGMGNEEERKPEVLVRSVMSLYEGAKTRVRVDSEMSEEIEVKVGMHQGSVLSPFLFALVVDVVTEFAKEGALSELLYADDLVLMSETIEGHMNKFL